jgi:hypothetical protein
MADFPATSPAIQPQMTSSSLALYIELFSNNPNLTTFETASGAWPTANLAILVPCPIASPFLVTQIYVFNGTAVSGNIDVGIYTAEGALVVAAGSTAQTGTSSIQAFNVTDTLLAPGLYYLACALDNNTGIVSHNVPPATQCRMMGVRQATSAFALPSTVTFAAAANAYVPCIYLTAAGVI